MSYSRSILLLAAMWIPAVLVGFILDRLGNPVEWWVFSGALVVYGVAIMVLWGWLRQRRNGSREPGVK
jgi:hypothetical protein